MNIVPQVIQTTPNGERGMDIYSKLLDSRIIMLDGEVNDQSASIIIAQLLYLDSLDGTKDISLYVNSPGGSISAGMGIIDTMNHIGPDVATIATGLAASMGAMVLLSGAKGKRLALPHAEIMIHQPLGGTQGQASDMVIAAQHIERTRETINQMIADATEQPINVVKDATERDNFMTAQEALNFGLIDKIL